MRHGTVRGGGERAGGGRGRRCRGGAGPLSPAELAQLRPAIEAAFFVARTGADATPPVAPPTALRPFLSFRRLSNRALERALRVLDEDEEFRHRVRDAVDVDDVGEAGWLFLDRPPDWEERLGGLVDHAARAADEAGAVEQAARLGRELSRAVDERDEAFDRARAAVEERDQVGLERDDERERRTEAESRVVELEAALDGARQERADAVRDLKALEARATARLDELRQAQDALAQARRQVDALTSAELETDADELEGGDGDGIEPSRSAPAVVDGSEAAGQPPADLDRATLGRVVARAADAATQLSVALAEVASLVTPVDVGATAPPLPVVEAERSPAPAAGADRGRPVVAPPARRQPTALPVGIFDDTPEAALHLLRTPGATLAVDGYNVSLAGWPTLALAAQRHRLVDALGALAARTRCVVVVVFDGADVGAGLPGESRPRGVQVRFTAPDVEADDELLDLVDALPPTRPVVVASTDRRVADGARRRGANVISGAQLLGVLGVET
ncbi:MAG TPA: NYN domain-containing protein [Acidimicrobiales bacterium]